VSGNEAPPKFVAGCTGKRSFARFDQASRAAKRRNRKDGGAHLDAYHCRKCNTFHVGESRTYGKARPMKEIER
jgi:hypothetical protein